MITCNRCGTLNPAGMLNCQVCGTPLASKIEQELSPRGQNQPALPAWLETLRAGDRPAAPTNTSTGSGFSAADLLDEGTLPSWMRSGRVDQQESTPSMPSTSNSFAQNTFSQSGPQPALRPSAQSAPTTGGEALPPQAIAANSLIDEKSLPSWMQKEVKQANQEPLRNIPASSLLQSDSLPEWMRSMPAPQGTPSLSDSSTYQTPARSNLPPSSPVVPQPVNPAPLSPGFSAGELIDPQSLPSWMSQGGQSNRQSTWESPQPASPAAQSGLSAASLLDASSLPPWLRQSQTGQEQTNIPVQPIQPAPASSAQGSLHSPAGAQNWPAAPSPIQPSAQGQTGSIAASSFVDPNALPEWMRSGNPANPSQSLRPESYNNPAPRIENVRVPSRPRNEINPSDNSEMAANVFASMLGVASSSPQYSGQPAASPPQSASAGAYIPPAYGPQGGQSMPAPSANLGSGIYQQIPSTPINYAQPPAAPAYGSAINNSQAISYPGSIPGAYASGMPQGASPYGNPPAYPANGMASPAAGPIFPGSPAEEQKPAKPAKRSIFDALRDFFSFR